MTTAAEFWGRIMPSGLTAEAELVQFWADAIECRCANRRQPPVMMTTGDMPGPYRFFRRRKRRDDESIVAVFGH